MTLGPSVPLKLLPGAQLLTTPGSGTVEQVDVEPDQLRDFVEAHRVVLVGVGLVEEFDADALQRAGQSRRPAAIVADDENGVRHGGTP